MPLCVFQQGRTTTISIADTKATWLLRNVWARWGAAFHFIFFRVLSTHKIISLPRKVSHSSKKKKRHQAPQKFRNRKRKLKKTKQNKKNLLHSFIVIYSYRGMPTEKCLFHYLAHWIQPYFPGKAHNTHMSAVLEYGMWSIFLGLFQISQAVCPEAFPIIPEKGWSWRFNKSKAQREHAKKLGQMNSKSLNRFRPIQDKRKWNQILVDWESKRTAL